MIQVVDIVLLGIFALLTVMRTPKTLALLKCFCYPFVTLNDTLHLDEAYDLDYLNWNSQLCRLEGALNTKFTSDPSLHQILIDDGNRPNALYLLDDTDYNPWYLLDGTDNAPTYLLDDVDFGANSYDFLVEIPAALGIVVNDPRVIQILNRYKLAGKQYKIILT